MTEFISQVKMGTQFNCALASSASPLPHISMLRQENEDSEGVANGINFASSQHASSTLKFGAEGAYMMFYAAWWYARCQESETSFRFQLAKLIPSSVRKKTGVFQNLAHVKHKHRLLRRTCGFRFDCDWACEIAHASTFPHSVAESLHYRR